MNNIKMEKKEKKRKKNIILYVFLSVSIIASIILIGLTYYDTIRINNILDEHTQLKNKVDNYNLKLKNTLLIHPDSIGVQEKKEKLLILQSEGLDLEKELFASENKVEKEIKELSNYHMKNWAFLIGIITAVLVFLGLEFNIKEKTTEIIKDAINGNEDVIKKMHDNNSWEFRLIEKANIIVVNTCNVHNHSLPKVLQWFGKKGYGNSYQELSDVEFNNGDTNNENYIIKKFKEKLKDKKFNILLIDDSLGDWKLKEDSKQNEAMEIAKKMPEKTMLIYFGPDNFPNKMDNYNNKREILDKISFTNAPSKLYSNIVDALKYLDIINPEINA